MGSTITCFLQYIGFGNIPGFTLLLKLDIGSLLYEAIIHETLKHNMKSQVSVRLTSSLNFFNLVPSRGFVNMSAGITSPAQC